MKKLLFILLILFNFVKGFSQSGSWQLLPNSPNQGGYRHDDVFFLNDSTGWLVNYDGYIYRTNDRGNSWAQQFYKPTAYFRCVGFADSLNGWAGNLGAQSWGGASDTNCLYQTNDGGTTWSPVTNIIGPKPMGLCGIYVLDSLHIYAVGRIEGPVHFMKSTDGGITWYSYDMSSLSGGLVDVKFFTPDTGYVVGASSMNFDLSHGIILKTVDGGLNWQTVYTSNQDSTWCWKQTWPTSNTGYVSLQRMNGPVHLLKTIDHGSTWNEILLTSNPFFCQGVGFINDSIGWIGGDFTNVNSFQTLDGGQSWSTVNIGYPVNRFRFTSDSTGYCCGKRVFRYSPNLTTLPPDLESDHNYAFRLASSNPTNSQVTVEFVIPSAQYVNLSLYDLPGRKVATLIDSQKPAGLQTFTFNLPGSINSIFFCSFSTNTFQKVISIIGAGKN